MRRGWPWLPPLLFLAIFVAFVAFVVWVRLP